MSKPLVSVIIPCFNVAGTVIETIASVLAQTMQDFEIVAVDNNSTDQTAVVLAEAAAHEPRLRVIGQPIQGISAARNAGIAAVRGEFIALLDSDDLWDRDYLEAHLANLTRTGAGISFSRVRMIDMSGRPTGQVTQRQLSGPTAGELLRSNPCTSLIVVRRDVFRDAGLFDEELRAAEDQEWLFRAAYAGVKFASLDRVLASYRVTPGGLSADLEGMLRGHDGLLQAAARVAPDLVARNRRLATAAMLRYCARRAIEHEQGAGTARRYLSRMFIEAPDLVVREPATTLKVAVRVVLAGINSLTPRRSVPFGTKEA